MIKYSLICSEKHEFEVWFSNSSDYDAQKSKLLISCPYCNSTKIEKGIMAPNIASSRKREKTAMEKDQNLSDLNSVIGKLRQHIKEILNMSGINFQRKQEPFIMVKRRNVKSMEKLAWMKRKTFKMKVYFCLQYRS